MPHWSCPSLVVRFAPVQEVGPGPVPLEVVPGVFPAGLLEHGLVVVPGVGADRLRHAPQLPLPQLQLGRDVVPLEVHLGHLEAVGDVDQLVRVVEAGAVLPGHPQAVRRRPGGEGGHHPVVPVRRLRGDVHLDPGELLAEEVVHLLHDLQLHPAPGGHVDDLPRRPGRPPGPRPAGRAPLPAPQATRAPEAPALSSAASTPRRVRVLAVVLPSIVARLSRSDCRSLSPDPTSHHPPLSTSAGVARLLEVRGEAPELPEL